MSSARAQRAVWKRARRLSPAIRKRVWTRGRSLELSALLAAREKEFAGSQGAHYYESAAALVSLFLDRSWAYRARYDRYIAALVSGERHDAAWAQAFGDVSLRRLQE